MSREDRFEIHEAAGLFDAWHLTPAGDTGWRFVRCEVFIDRTAAEAALRRWGKP